MAAQDGTLPAVPAASIEELAAGETALPPARPGRAALRRFLAHRMAVLSLLVLLTLVVLALCANLLPLIDPTDGDAYSQDSLPSRLHLLGTDDAGHDLLSALIFGLRPALAAGILGQAACMALGLLVGLLAAYHGGWVDGLLSRLTDLLFAVPPFLVAFLAVAVLGADWEDLFAGAGRAVLITVVLGLVGWPSLMRFVRGLALSLTQQQFVEAARATGVSDWRIITRHLLPNTLGLTLVQATFGVGTFIAVEAGLSILGLGVQPPNPDLGALVVAGAPQLDLNALEALAPSVVLGMLILGFAFLGDGLRDALDPRGQAER